MTVVRIEENPLITANFMQPARTRVFWGGRGSGKTKGIAKRVVLNVYRLAEMGVRGQYLSSRERLNSLDESSLQELKEAIFSEPWLADYYDVGEKYIRTKNRRIYFSFAGLTTNLDSIKSKAQLVGNWTDEAEGVSEAAWRKLIPTLRSEGEGWHAENIISFNPEKEDSATYKRFVKSPAGDCLVTRLNWDDNPWFPEILNLSRLDDLANRPDSYDHIWNGGFLTISDAIVFSGRFEVKDFTPQSHWNGPYQGGDFGFSQDPTAAVRCYENDGYLYISHEAYKRGLELDHTADYVTGCIPNFEDYVTRWDNARPESISYLKRHGLPRSTAVSKWPGSVIDGVSFLKSFKKIIIHPRCQNIHKEFRLYSHKVDKKTEDIMPDIVDKDNHGIDALRYAVDPMIKPRRGAPVITGR